MAAARAPFIPSSIFNSSAAYLPSPNDLIMAFPRLARRASSFAWAYMPDQLDNFLAIAKGPGSVLADATSKTIKSNATIMASATASSARTGPTSGPQVLLGSGVASWVAEFLGIYQISNLDGFFSYLASRWAWSTLAMAVLLKRTQVYTSSRRTVRLNWRGRVVLRLIPILLLGYQITTILQAMRCQTGRYIPESEYREIGRVMNGALVSTGGFHYRLSSALLFWQSEEQSCIDVRMIPPNGDFLQLTGSSSLLWPLFITLCISQLVETIACSLRGRQPSPETGMTLFEHSMAFAEAQAALRSSVGLGLFGLPKTITKTTSSIAKSATSSTVLKTAAQSTVGTMYLHQLNIPAEVLFIGFISSCSHVSSHALGVAGLQSKYRLVNTGIWGLCLMSALIWYMVKFFQSAGLQDVYMVRYPTICILGFIPHLIIAGGLLICCAIYLVALGLTLVSPPDERFANLPFKERLRAARENLQANTILSSINLSWREDFYTTLLKFGFTALTATTEAVYFNEGAGVAISGRTWLEEKRYVELSRAKELSNRLRASIPPEIQGDSRIAEGVGLVDEEQFFVYDGRPVVSGFARERKTTMQTNKFGAAAAKEEGVGGSQRSGRWWMSWRLMWEISGLVGCCFARAVVFTLRTCGINSLPRKLEEVARYNTNQEGKSQEEPKQQVTRDFWMLTDEGNLARPTGVDVDVEVETRRRLLAHHAPEQERSEEAIDSNLYGWWKMGGWWGELDNSGDYIPNDLDDDTTSMISMSTSASQSEDDWEDLDAESGRQTPTQADFGGDTRETTPSVENPMSRLANLLAPKTLEEKKEARLLAPRLLSDGPMTRSQYHRGIVRENGRYRVLAPDSVLRRRGAEKLSPAEEEDMLEQVILSRRAEMKPEASSSSNAPATGSSWASGADGMGADGPQCVICHSSPRTVLVWPCRCLSLCEDCRVSLAMNNFGTCVCCRREVVAFSRLYVP